ncbi:MAG: glycoside hydrolase [Pseudozobellia sp.]|nr:glycoside hydrolase [Pseudozobellia sp.]MBG49264.1 glycoside hydrolase [Pseudozobellia sp.]|tara:strand:+ start:1373106 stop:1376414 length:3309 start_codon:yes stop_codon:yes gene_type:complete
MNTKASLFIGLLICMLLIGCAQEPPKPSFNKEELAKNFQNPPNEAKPRVWWHWMNGNITKEGIKNDLNWMAETGIGGFQNFDANLFTPLVTDKKLVFMTPEWQDAFKYTTDLAIEKGLEMAIAGSPGWSETGGPWVEAKDGMKKYVWSEITVQGGQNFKGTLPKPPTETGGFQNVPSEGGIEMSEEHQELPEFYGDAAAFAFRIPDDEQTMAELMPKVTSSGGKFSLKTLTDGDLHTATELPPGEVGEEIWIQYSFDRPVTFRSYSVVGANHNALEQFRGSPQNRSLYVSDDGKDFRKVTDIPGSLVPQTSGSFKEETAKYWRFAYETLPPSPPGLSALFGAPMPTKPDGVPVAEFVLYQADRIDQFENKAGFSAWVETDVPTHTTANAITKEEVIDLTSQLGEDGSLNWDVPEGKWKIVRFGYSLTGRQNHPASPEATGLEVDKLDEDAVRRYINHYLDLYKEATGGQMGEKGLSHVILDSYEAGHMNWTHNFPDEFKKRRGYDILPWMPVLLGRVVQSAKESEKFLWDFRKTIGEMISDNHYDVIGEELHKRNMGRYTESHENGRIFLADGMDVKRNADIPMSAMWTPGSLAGGSDEEVRSEGDIRESASVANIFGKPFVAAESMTSIQNAFSWHPEKLKRTADLEMASGLNRFVIHTSVHQPLDDKMPGFSLGPFGQYFTRQETWSGAGAKAWIDYLGRSSYLLQQGQNVADVLYLYGENDNITRITQQSLPDVPKGHEFDFVSATILKEAITGSDGRLKAESGVTYAMLMLDEGTQRMTLSTLQKLKELADAGIKIKGKKPLESPSLSDDDGAFQEMAEEIWSKPNVGANVALDQVPDVDFSETDHDIRFRHRATGDSHIYWLNNRSAQAIKSKLGFRVTGKKPQKWNPQTGEVSDIGYSTSENQTWIDLDYTPWDAFFILFIDETDQNSFSVPEADSETIAEINGPWQVAFQGNRGAPSSKAFEDLVSWTDQEEEGIKHFSGTATYSNTFSISNIEDGAKYTLDLGEVKNIAEVSVNGNAIGTLWKTPFTIDISDALKSGDNTLEVKVTNTWVNRLIGDAVKEPAQRITFTTMPFYRGGEELLPSGLMGDVKILQMK